MTKESNGASDENGLLLSPYIRFLSQFLQHVAYEPSVMPFFFFNGLDSASLLWAPDRLPMAAVGVRRGKLS